MDEQKKTSGSLALNSTPRVITIAPSTPVRDRKLRVAAYARVSSRSEDQLNSFAAQNAHYTELITANPENKSSKQCFVLANFDFSTICAIFLAKDA